MEAEVTSIITTKSQPITTHITPTSFLDLLKTFTEVLQNATDELTKGKQRYFDGLEMLLSTQQSVTTMQETLERNKPMIVEAQRRTGELLEKIDIETAAADKERAAVAVEEAQANRIAEGARAVKLDCEANLNAAMPALNASLEAVSSIDKRELVELKTMQNPNEKIRKTMEAVCVLLDVKPNIIKDPNSTKKTIDYWTPTRTRVMADVEEFKKLLINYDKENMDPDIFENRIKPYISDRNFKPEVVKQYSKALEGVCRWVIAMEVVLSSVQACEAKEGAPRCCRSGVSGSRRSASREKRSLAPSG